MRTYHVPSTDGVVLEVHDRGTSPSSSSAGLERDEPTVLLLAHANGFHSRTWDAAAEELMRVASSAEGLGWRTGGVRVITFSFRAHGKSTAPISGGRDALRWGKFSEDLLAVVEQTPGLVRDKLVGIGHSLGAHAMLRAEALRPGTFASLYCFEPIFVCDPGKLPPFVPMSLERAAARRRRTFPSRSDARAAYGSKPPLNILQSEVLDAYVQHGFVDATGGEKGEVTLACTPVTELTVFACGGVEAEANKLVGGGKVRCPVTVAHGATHDPRDVYGRSPNDAIYSSIISPVIAEYIGENAFVEYVPALTHFGPLQDTVWFAKSVGAHLSRVGVAKGRSLL